MIEVRIRYASEAVARHLCQWPATELDKLIPTIEGWGVQDSEPTDASGQIVLDNTGAYFEVVINDEEDESGAGA